MAFILISEMCQSEQLGTLSHVANHNLHIAKVVNWAPVLGEDLLFIFVPVVISHQVKPQVTLGWGSGGQM